jgi:serine/threonine-protein kinase
MDHGRGSPVLAAFLTALVTTVGAFFALTVADEHGLLRFLHKEKGDVEIPSITGVTVDQARDLLRGRDLLLTLQAERPDPNIPAGNIAGQVPLAGSRAARGTAVQAFVSSGAGAASVPSLAGFQPEDAIEQLKARKLVPGRRQEAASETIPAGQVIGTDPAAGRSVAPGTTVGLVISTGTASRTIPKLLGLRVSKAKKVLEDAGFKLGKTRIGSSDNFDEEQIIKQTPTEFSLAPPGSVVDVVVNE